MKTIFHEATRDEIISRISNLDENNKPVWGKMNVFQMLRHCSLWEDMMLGKQKYKRAFAGYLFGKMALKSVLKNDAPLRRSTPTIPALLIKETNGNSAKEKRIWISKIKEYEHFSNTDFIHPFFGRMTQEQIGYFVYKHIDHHLRQFNG